MSTPRRYSLLRDRIDARALLAYLAALLVLAFAIQHPVGIAALTAAVWLVLVGVLEPREYRPYLTYGSITAVGVMLLNPLMSRAGQTVLWTSAALPLAGHVAISAEGIFYGLAMGLRLLSVVGVFALYSVLIDPDALYRLVAPFSLGSALVTALSIRLFPASVRDAGRISDAMRARGLALDSGSYVGRVRSRGPVMEALMMTSLDRAMDLAESLEARGYGREGRTRRPLAPLASRDRLMLALAAALAVAGMAWAIVGARYSYYPLLGNPAAPLDLAAALVLGVLAALPLLFEWGWDAWLSSKSNS